MSITMKIRSAAVCTTLLFGCGPAENNETNNLTPSADCSSPAELDTGAYRDGGTIEAGNCYLVNDRLLVSGGPLVVEEGVVLQFADNAFLEISEDGRLTVQGTSEDPVFFTGQEETNGFWKGVALRTKGADNVMDYLVVEYAGKDGWSGAPFSTASMDVNGGGTLSNCEIRNGGGHGMNLAGASELSVSGCTFTNNVYGAYVHPNVASSLAGDNEFVDNDTNVVRVSFGNTDAVTSEQTWADIGVPWRIEARTGILAPLTLSEGAVLEFNEDVSFNVSEEGRLTAVGTADAPVTFTGVEKLRGYWKGIGFETRGTANQFDFVTMEYGGSDAWTGGPDTESMLRMNSGSSLSVQNSTFRESGNYAIWAGNDVQFDAFTANTFEANTKAIVMHPNTVGQVAAENTFAENDEDVVRVSFGNTDTLIDDATWEALDVPYLVTVRTFIGGPLTIDAGARIEFLEDASIIVDDEGSLAAIGTPELPIVFTAVAGEETAGYWHGINFGNAASANELDNVEIRYAGSDTWYGGADANGAVFVPGAVAIRNTLISDISGWGINVSGDGTLTACENVTFENISGDNVKADEIFCN